MPSSIELHLHTRVAQHLKLQLSHQQPGEGQSEQGATQGGWVCVMRCMTGHEVRGRTRQWMRRERERRSRREEVRARKVRKSGSPTPGWTMVPFLVPFGSWDQSLFHLDVCWSQVLWMRNQVAENGLFGMLQVCRGLFKRHFATQTVCTTV